MIIQNSPNALLCCWLVFRMIGISNSVLLLVGLTVVVLVGLIFGIVVVLVGLIYGMLPAVV